MENIGGTSTEPMNGMILPQQRIDREVAAGNWLNKILPDYLDEVLRTSPGQTALIARCAADNQEQTLSYHELDDHAQRIAGNLIGLGIKKGDVVSLQLPNWWQFVAIHLACLKIGAVSNPLMPIFRERELDFMIGFAESRVLIVPKTFHGFDHEELGGRLVAKIPTLKHLIVVGGTGGNAFERILLKQPEVQAPKKSPLQPNDVVLLLFTSGTTGRPKGVLHTSNTLLSSARQITNHMSLGPNDVGFMPAPFAHMIGFCFGMTASIYLGTPLVILDAWNAQTAVELIARHKVTFSAASAPFMSDLAAVPHLENHDLSAFRIFLTAGAPIMEPVVKEMTDRLGVAVVPGWGMTEVIQATASDPVTSADKQISDGAAMPGSEVCITDLDGAEKPPGQPGVLKCRGATLFVGYFKRPDLYEIDENGWFDTGDLARMDAAGNLRIVGRDKDIIIRGGENVPVFEVESILCKMPQIADLALVAMPDDRLGERGCLFVTLHTGKKLPFEKMVAFLSEHNLAQQYHPEHIQILDEMPRTASGKIQKFVLRERARQLAQISLEESRVPE